MFSITIPPLMNSVRASLAVSLLMAGMAAAEIYAESSSDDVAFLREHTPVIVLSDRTGSSKVALAPAWQGRVMTSTAAGDQGFSCGWINRELIASGKLLPHINVFGGEDRFWLGPEGGTVLDFLRARSEI